MSIKKKPADKTFKFSKFLKPFKNVTWSCAKKQVCVMSVNRLTVHSLLCICRVCSTRKVFILKVSSVSLSLILTFTYPVISHRKKYAYCWFTTFKWHILLAASSNPIPNDVNWGLCFAQVVGDIRINNYLPPCLLCIYHSYLSVLLVLISPFSLWSWL